MKAEEEEEWGLSYNIPAFIDLSFCFHPCLAVAVKFSMQLPYGGTVIKEADMKSILFRG